MAVCDDWEFVLAVSADYPDMLDAAQLHSVHIVNQAVVGKRFQLRTCDRIRYFKDNRLISLFCNPRVQHGIENIRACLRIVDVQNKEIEEIVPKSEGIEIIFADTDGKNIILRVFLDVFNGSAYTMRIHRAYFDKTESEIVEIIVKFAVSVKTCAESDRIIKTEPEYFFLQSLCSVVVNPSVYDPTERNFSEGGEVFQGNF